jgi:uncharacterized repeat protein (TIGR03803 family)
MVWVVVCLVLSLTITANAQYRILHQFTGEPNDGSWPALGKLVHIGSTFYGTTGEGGSNDGKQPFCGTLVLSDTILYGMTTSGGINDSGAVFQINTNGKGFQILHSFSGSDGKAPFGSLLLVNSTLYGMASEGGTNGSGVIFALDVQQEIDYFGQTPPQDISQKFTVYPSGSSPMLHSCPSFSPSGDEAFWATWPDLNTYTQTIYYRKKENGLWLNPVVAPFSGGKYSDKLPCFSGDGNRVYFTSDRPLSGNGNPVDENIWFIEKNDSTWSVPICLDNSVNTSQSEGWISVAANNNLYFGRDDKLYYAKWDNDHFLSAQSLPNYPTNIGALGCIAPDESYIILQSVYVQNSSGDWIDDLYIIFQPKNVLSKPIKLDSKINSMPSKCFAKISPDGKFLFFLGANNDAYWVSTDFTKTLTGIETGHNLELPSTIRLNQNYPNPFNPSTVISYRLSAFSDVKLMIYNVLGQKIKTLVNSFQTAGEYSLVWDATDEKNNPVSSGIYFYRLQTEELTLQKKMLLLR